MRTCFVLVLTVALAAGGALGHAAAADGAPAAVPSLLPPAECGGEGVQPCPSGGAPGGGRVLLPAGAPAPSFALSDPEGAPLSFQATAGMEPALLLFWSLFCPPCQEEMPMFADLSLRHPPPELRVIAVNLDGPSLARSVSQYAQMRQLPFPVAMDEKQGEHFAAADAYGVTGTPSLVLIGADGTVVWRHEGRVDPLELESAILDGLR